MVHTSLDSSLNSNMSSCHSISLAFYPLILNSDLKRDQPLTAPNRGRAIANTLTYVMSHYIWFRFRETPTHDVAVGLLVSPSNINSQEEITL